MNKKQRYRERKISKGLCPDCGKPRDDLTFKTCQECRNKASEKGRQWRIDHKSNKVCEKCNKYPAKPGHTHCQYCLRKKTERAAFIRGERHRAGLCGSCGINPHLPGKKTCQSCLDRGKKRYEQVSDNLTGVRKKRREQGICVTCGITPCTTYDCKDCRDKKNKKILARRYNGNALKAMERDNFQCRLCGKADYLHIHHIDGNGESVTTNPNHSLENLITLCRSCHISISNLRTYKANLNLVIHLLSA